MLDAIPMFLESFARLPYELEQMGHEEENIPPASFVTKNEANSLRAT
jgi:hypothetical protein